MSTGLPDYKSYQEEEYELTSASMMGDIREDIEFLGLTLTDVVWIAVNSLVWGGLVVLSPLSYWFSIPIALGILVFNFVGRILKWPYRRKRWIKDRRQKKTGKGEDIADFLGVEEESWFYRSPRMLQIVLKITAPPWEVAEVSKKRKRLTQFENFLRSCVVEGFEAQFSSEQVPDYRHHIWNEKRSKETFSEGIEGLKLNRIRMWEGMAEKRMAKRSEYTLRLRISEISIAIRERDDEPEGLSKEESRRHRMVTELHEKMERLLSPLRQSGHSCEIVGGTHLPELIGRWWDPHTWEVWKQAGGVWDEDDNVVLPAVIHADTTDTTESEQEADMSPEEDKEANGKRAGWLRRLGAWFIARWNAIRGRFSKKKRVVVIPSMLPEHEDHEETTEIASDTQETMLVPTGDSPAENGTEANSERLMAKISRRFRSSIGILKEEFNRFLQWKRKRKATQTGVSPVPDADPEADQTVEVYRPYTLSGAHLLTAPAATGVTFLASNIAAAMSSDDHPVTVIDLSPDRGVVTVLNPLPDHTSEHWSVWKSSHVAGLLVYTPDHPVMLEHVQELIEQQLERAAVVVDMPWDYPDRAELMKLYPAIAVVDSDYHHWLQWEKAVQRWEGEIWLNQTDKMMQPLVSNLIQNHFGKAETLSFPMFYEAKQWIYQGRPLAIDKQARRFFEFTEKEA